MKAIIPVAGIGTRLQPLTNKTPKVLINVAGKPMLFHLIDDLVKHPDINTIILVIGYLGEQIVEAINKYYVNTDIKFEFVEQKEMLGLGHAVYHAKDYVRDEPVLIILGDTIFEFDLDSVLSSEYSVVCVKDVDDIRRFGIVESENGFIIKMIEKPSGPEVTKSKSAIAGIYFLKDGAKLFKSIEYLMENDIRTKNEYQLTDALQKMICDGEKMLSSHIRNWFDCGKPETLLNTNAYILKRDFSDVSPGVFLNSKITSPVFIGKNCIIENSEVGPFVTLGENITIRNSQVSNSLICDDAVIENAELNESAIGNHEFIEGKHEKIIKADGSEVSF